VVQLRLYVAGQSPNSVLALSNLEQFCKSLPPGSFELRIVDVWAQPSMALQAALVVTPTLELLTPSGDKRRLLGTLNDPVKLQNLVASVAT
jgi:circadian clock protein KaiB